MPHIHTDDGQHDLVVSMYIIRTDFARPRAMLHMHKKFRKWMPYGGHVELHENPWDTVRHELLEESGYELGQLRLLQPTDRMHKVGKANLHPQPININTHRVGENHYHTALDYAFVTDEEPARAVGESESQEFRLVPAEELLAMNEGEIFESNQDAFRYIFEVCMTNWEQIPLK